LRAATAPLRGASRLTVLLVALTAAHLALAAAAGSVYALAFALFLAGAAIAPTYATVFALVERAAPAGTVTEAFAWLATAVAVGAAVGAGGAGAIAEHTGPAAVFVFAGGAGACALLATLTRSSTVAACQTS
jgi:MFS family permease